MEGSDHDPTLPPAPTGESTSDDILCGLGRIIKIKTGIQPKTSAEEDKFMFIPRVTAYLYRNLEELGMLNYYEYTNCIDFVNLKPRQANYSFRTPPSRDT